MQIPVPNLPGYVSSEVPHGHRSYAKRQGLTYVRGYAMESAPIMLASEFPGAQQKLEAVVQPDASHIGDGSASHIPQWVANDRKVLRWFGYFREAVVADGSPEEQRVRRVVVHYYLVDNTLDVSEPRQDDSGIMQGAFIKRHKILDAAGNPVKPEHFAVGTSVTLYTRALHIVDADDSTRRHMEGLGVALLPAQPYPADPAEGYRAAFARKTAGPPPKPNSHLSHGGECASAACAPQAGATGNRLQKYLENSRKVLRFYCVWDDRQPLNGDRRPYVLNYYLEDDTVEVLEVHENNSGRDAFPVFLRRARLPKEAQSLGSTPGGVDKRTPCYTATDLRLGTFVNIHGRRFFLHDCDDFTRSYYHDSLGYAAEEMAGISVVEQTALRVPGRELPAFNGFGSLEDSAQNCKSLLPQPPKKDFYRLMQCHRIVLRFNCRLSPVPGRYLSPADASRLFVLSYFMGDDTLSIFEPPLRNSGLPGGKFLERMKVFKPAASVESAEAITEHDLHVGAVLVIHQRTFELLEGDEFTMQFMENNSHRFLNAKEDAALQSLREQLAGRQDELSQQLVSATVDDSSISSTTFESVLKGMGVRLTRHQVLTIYRQLPAGSQTSAAIMQRLEV